MNDSDWGTKLVIGKHLDNSMTLKIEHNQSPAPPKKKNPLVMIFLDSSNFQMMDVCANSIIIYSA